MENTKSTKDYSQHKGKQIAEQIKWEDKFSEEVKNFDLIDYLWGLERREK